MNFSEFLKEWRKQKNYPTIKAQFDALGGDKTLGISLRRFVQIESGQHPPTDELLAAIFGQVAPAQKKILLKAYFESVFIGNPGGKEIIQHIDFYLQTAINTSQRSVWDRPDPRMDYTDTQLDYLNNPANEDAFKLFKKVLLLDPTPIPIRECRVEKSKLKRLEKLDLLRIDKDCLRATRHRFKLPRFEETNPKTMVRANDFILRHLTGYLSREGGSSQKLKFTMLMMKSAVADRVLGELESFHNYIMSLHEPEPKESDVPFLFVAFSKKLEGREL